MINLALSLAAALVVALAIGLGTEFGWVAAAFPAILVGLVLYVVLVRRTQKQLQALFETMQKDLQARRLERAIQTLQQGFPLARWQFLVAAQLHSAIGQIHFLQKDFEKAAPHLEKAYARDPMAQGMRAAGKYKRRDVAGANAVFEQAVKANKKDGVLWSAYAWVLEEQGAHDRAIAVLGRAVAANPKDEKLKASLQALQNGKKLKLGKLYAEQWYQFHLEGIPPQFAGPGFHAPGGRRAIYGRR
jgi:tetratricopeptide (TPR) repeat protein